VKHIRRYAIMIPLTLLYTIGLLFLNLGQGLERWAQRQRKEYFSK
jgi:Sec-independent protein secretion pathway component TatC